MELSGQSKLRNVSAVSGNLFCTLSSLDRLCIPQPHRESRDDSGGMPQCVFFCVAVLSADKFVV